MDKFLALAQENFEEAVSIRRTLHACPETGDREFETKKFIISCLESWGIEVTEILDTAVIGLIRGAKPGKTAALRADMDALAMTENTGLEFSSKNPGVMHACGHDMHMAAVLCAAKILSSMKDELCGNVKLLFQPAEEVIGGAGRMIDAGCMENPKVDAAFGAHILPGIDPGKIAVKYGKYYASAFPFEIIVKGKSSHGAEPEKGVDAIAAAAQVITTAQVALTRITSPMDPAIITFGTFNGGTAANIIPDEARITGLIRTLDLGLCEKVSEMLKTTTESVAASFGAVGTYKVNAKYPGVTNDNAMTDIVAKAAEKVLGRENVVVLENPTMTSEDFGYFINASTGCFYGFGAGDTTSLHTVTFSPDEKALITAAAVHCRAVWDFLHEN